MSKQAPAAAQDAPAGEAPAGRKSIVSKLKIPGIIVAIVAVEWLAAALYLPGSSQSSPAAHAEPADEDSDAADEVTDLTDAGLGLIKRRILETTNKTLGKPLLQGVVFSEFSFVEQ